MTSGSHVAARCETVGTRSCASRPAKYERSTTYSCSMSISASGAISVPPAGPSSGSVNTPNPCEDNIDVADARPENATACPSATHARASGTIGFAWPSPPAKEKRTRNASDSGGRRLFPDGVRRALVGTQALERRRSELSDLRHLEELHLADDLRLHPGRPLHLRELRIRDRGRVANERLQQLQHVREHPVGEPRSDLPDPAELSVEVRSDEQRAERSGPAALARRPSQDHAVLTVQELDLPPVGRSLAGQVPRAELLRDDALELQLPSRFGELETPLVDVVREVQPGRVLLHGGLQPRASLLERQRRQVLTLEPQDVERDEDDRNRLPRPFDLRGGMEIDPRLQHLERGPALLVRRDDLPVQDAVHRVHDLVERRELRIRRRLVTSGPGDEPRCLRVGVDERPDAVELRLEPPLGGVERRVTALGEHRRELRRRLDQGNVLRAREEDQPIGPRLDQVVLLPAVAVAVEPEA